MRTSILIAGWSLLVLLLPVERSAGQDGPPTDRPYVYFSASPEESTDAEPKQPLRQLNLRPNTEQTYFVYVYNPLKDKKTVNVQLVSSPRKGLFVVAAEKTVEVPGKKGVRVQLAANKAQVPPTLPPTPGPDGKLIPQPAPAIPLAANPHIRAIVADETEERGAKVGLIATNAYTNIEPTFADNKLKITVTRKQTDLVGPPIHVKLTPRDSNGAPIDPARLAVEGNMLEGLLAIGKNEDGAQKVELTLNTAGLGDGFADVSIDEFARAGWYKLNGGAADPPFGVAAPKAAIPGKPLPVRFMAPPSGTDLRIVFDRTGSPDGEQIKAVPSPRNEGIGLRVGDSGEAIFVTRSDDWIVEFPTQGVYGKRDFFGRSGTKDSPKTTVRFDATGPAIDILDAEPAVIDPKKPATLKMFRPGQKVRVIAGAKDAESDIDPTKGVTLYMGEKPEPGGKAPPGSQVKAGVKIADRDAYEAIFEIPLTTQTTEVRIGAIFTNTVGLPGGREALIRVDYTPPEVSVLSFDPAKPPLAAYKPGDVVRLIASAFDDESGIDLSRPPLFFLGDPPGPDGKPTQGTLVLKEAEGVIKGVKSEQGQPFYAASLILPKDIKKETELKVGVWFVNGVGLPGVRLATVKLDMDFTTATVKVKVLQGDRVQPGIMVWLLDRANKIAGEAKTDECGVAVFEKVLPGTYIVWGVKKEDQNSQDFKSIVARGGDTIPVELSVKRQPPPPIQPQQPGQQP
jgi:hypothetical protein